MADGRMQARTEPELSGTSAAPVEALAAADEAREAAAVHHSDADRLRSVHE